MLIDKPSPGPAAVVAQDHAEAVADTRDRTAVLIAEAVADGLVVFPHGHSPPDVAVLIAQANVITLAVTVNHGARRVLKPMEAAGQRSAEVTPTVDHETLCRRYEIELDAVNYLADFGNMTEGARR
jgi:hypothetical protein